MTSIENSKDTEKEEQFSIIGFLNEEKKPYVYKNKFLEKINEYFQITERKSSISTEILSGLINFIVSSYIILLLPSMFESISSKAWNGIFFGTILNIIVVTSVQGLVGNIPLIYAPGLGSSSFMLSLINDLEMYEYGQVLILIFCSGIIFLLVTLTNIRKKIIDSMPLCIKNSMTIGLGVFLSYLGLTNSYLLRFLLEGPISEKNEKLYINATITLISLLSIILLENRKIKGGIFIGIIIGSIVSILFQIIIEKKNPLNFKSEKWIPPIKDYYDFCIKNGFIKGFSYFKKDIENNPIQTITNGILIIFTFTLIDIFDTVGTIIGISKRANLLKEDGYPNKFNEIMIVDSSAAIFSSLTGTPTCNAYLESTAGIEIGGKTGLTSIITSFFFFVFFFISPIIKLIPSDATYAALIYIGSLMFENINTLDFHDKDNFISSYFTIFIMPFTKNISFGIAFGLLVFISLKIGKGDFFQVNFFAYVVLGLFLIYFATQNLFR